MKRSELKRTSWIKRGEKPLSRSKRINASNPERRARVQAKRDAKAKTPEQRKLEREARRIADARANGMCECGCGYPFGEYRLDRKHFHHEHYDPPRGIMVRRRCHERIEREMYPHRHGAGRSRRA